MTNGQKIEDLNKENMIRLRAEVLIIADRLRRHLMGAYAAQWGESLIEGKPLRLRSDPDAINAIAFQAAVTAFGNVTPRLESGDDSDL